MPAATLLQINTAAGRGASGGVPESIGRMAAARGMRCYMGVGRPNGTSASELIGIGSRPETALHWAATRLADRHGLHSRRATVRFIKKAEAIGPDVIHLHNIHGYYLHVPTLFEWLRGAGKPVVWTLHDCWPLTGHCAFFDEAGCARWQSGCHHCPLLDRYPASILIDRSTANYRMKRQIFTSLPELTLVAVSRWLDNVVAKSFLRDIPRRVIPNGIDLGMFRPCSEKAPESAPLMLGVASKWDTRKGLDSFLRLRQMLPDRWRIRLIGLSPRQIRRLPRGVEGFGRINSPEALARHYSEASVFVNASLAETSNIAKMEALACGTPVATYSAGGSAEGLSEEYAFTARPGDVAGLLAAAMSASACPPVACRKGAGENFDMSANFEAYFRLYGELAPQLNTK